MSTQRPHLLLTNDDGIDSPLFELLIEGLSPFGDLSIAVPAEEQSWQGKSMTRHGDVKVTRTQVAGHDAFAIGGTPADCVSIALHNLLPKSNLGKPDLVVSGINVGLNAGLSLVWSSGTVGACLEGNIAGIPGLALSQQLNPAVYGHWDKTRSFEADTLAQLRAGTQTMLPKIWAQLVVGQAREPITHNVNLPFELTDPQLENSRLGHSWYQQCFVGDVEGGFKHRMLPFERDTHPQADNNVLARGRVSVTKLDMRTFGTLPTD